MADEEGAAGSGVGGTGGGASAGPGTGDRANSPSLRATARDLAAAARAGDAAAVRESLGVAHDHPPGTAAAVAVLAVVLGVYASWLLADLGLRLPALAVGAVVAAVGLYRRPDRRGVVVAGLYALAALVAVTPLVLDLSFVAAAAGRGVNPLPFVFSPADLVALLVFVLLAAVPAGAARLLARRGG